MVFIISVIGIHAQEYFNNFAPIDLDKEMIKTHPRVIVNDFEPIRKRLKTDSIMQVWFESLQNDQEWIRLQ